MKKNIEVEIEVPTTPTRLSVSVGSVIIRGEEGDDEVTGRKEVPVSEFTDAELRAVGRQWTEALLAEAARQRVVIAPKKG